MNGESQEKQLQDFEASPWQDQSWELVSGADKASTEFTPMQIAVVSEQSTVDPMFADYGGRSQLKGDLRWHLPNHLSVSAMKQSSGVDEEGPVVHELTDDEIEQLKQNAYELGHQTALEESAHQSTEKMQAMEASFQHLFEDLRRQVDEENKILERKCVDLSLQIANKLIETAVEINPEYIVKLVREAIAQSGAAQIKKIRVSPEDMEFIKYAGVARTIKEFDGTWDFVDDPTIRSGCVLETSAGENDYQLDKAWERIKDNVVKVIR